MTLHGIIPIVPAPFDSEGQLDEPSLRRVVRHELSLNPQGLGVNGFATEAYKLTDAERLRCAEIVADEVAGRVPLIIGLPAPGLQGAVALARAYVALQPAAIMTLPPNTMGMDERALVEFYVAFADALTADGVPVMVQHSPQIPAYSGLVLSVDGMAEIARRTPNARYFKIEGKGSAERIAALRPLVNEDVRLFGGVGGIAMKDELKAGAAGLLPGVGFNRVFHQVWAAWSRGDEAGATHILENAQSLIDAVSGRGHEFSLHARKTLLVAMGVIETAYVRPPTVAADPAALADVVRIARELGLLEDGL